MICSCEGIVCLVDIDKVPDFNKMYELYDPCTLMFFYRYVRLFWMVFHFKTTFDLPLIMLIIVQPRSSRNKHIMIDLGTGNNNKM